MKQSLLLLIIAIQALIVSATVPSGIWSGKLDLMGTEMPLVIDFDHSTLKSPLQSDTAIPAEIVVNGDTVTINVKMIGLTYRGVYSKDTINGNLSQSGMKFPMVFIPGDYIPERPQTPTPPFPYTAVDMSIPIDGGELSGTLTVPIQYYTKGASAVPLVIMVSGSGQQNRDEEIMGHKPFAVIAHHLALAGIASFRYDDRGFGKSTGSLDGATTSTFAADAQAAVDYFRNFKPHFKSVGILGHSEGGTIAFMLGARNKVDFIVSLAGPASSGKDVLLYQNYKLLSLMVGDEVANQYVEGLKALLDYMISHPDAKTWPEVDTVAKELILLSPEMVENYRQIISTRNPWMDYFISYNPLTDISSITCPVMAIGGMLDMQVDAEGTLETLRAYLSIPENNQNLKMYPGLNHLLQHSSTGLPQEYGDISETISPEVLSDISRWIIDINKDDMKKVE